jgi:hypothetical protein
MEGTNKMRTTQARHHLCRLLISALILNTLFGFSPMVRPVQANGERDRVIIVNADQPNVWTLEQAHYLLSQMHRRNLDLRAKKLDALDPNAINGLRFDLLQMLIEAGASFNEASGFTNKLLAKSKQQNAERRQDLIVQRDKLRQESIQLTRDISGLETEKAKAKTQEEKDQLDAQIAAKTKLRTKVDKEIELDDNELKTLGDASGEFKSTEPQVQFDESKLPKGVLSDAFKSTAQTLIQRFNQAPSLNASMMLENFLQMQYEIIAKQLTLLRDEVGPDERLLFLELPQTVNVAHHEADQKWAQSWWRIVGYTKKSANATAHPSDNGACSNNDSRESNCQPISTAEKVRRILNSFKSGTQNSDATQSVDWVDLDPDAKNAVKAPNRTLPIDNRSVRTVELIPRQGSLNVNDMKLRVKAGAFSAVASFLFGFGARLNIQRQREQFSQFVQQELYSSAFGKGSREFGWTFTAMPGTDRLLSGVRTTYAVVVVPQQATSLIVESNGCYFPRAAYQPNDFADTMDSSRWGDSKTSRGCGTGKSFLLPIPGDENGNNAFWVKGISFQPVPKGKRVVVLITGSNFSSQIGVMVDGVSLLQSIGMAQPLLRDDSDAGTAAAVEADRRNIHGTVERVDANKVVISFEMPPDYQGTPTITLIAPGRAIDINWLTVSMNGEPAPTSLINYSTKMFGSVPVASSFRIDSLELFKLKDGQLGALIHGAGFAPSAVPNPKTLYLNGVSRTFKAVSPGLIVVDSFPAPTDETISATLVYNDATVSSAPVPNPK